ncbi:MAG TPA: DUF1566 domain-containing protein [Myxococcales bacterium]|nr:DUF1566 domain-containing protein [Myxococcales bacterium]
MFTTVLAQLNTNLFGGHSDWRLPTVGEMQSILWSQFWCERKNPRVRSDPSIIGGTPARYSIDR